MTPQGLWFFLPPERSVVEDFPANRKTARHPREEEPKAHIPEKKIGRVVEGEVIRRKKPFGKRIKEAFLGGDDRSVFQFMLEDVIVPNIRDMVYEANQQGMARLLYPGSDPRPFSRGVGSRPSDPRRNVNYNGISRGPARDRVEERSMSRRARATHDFGEVVIPTRPEAEGVLEGMYALLEEYDVVAVSDLYEMIGVSSQFTDRKWGWTDLRGSDIRRVREGWLLDLPRPEVID